MIEGSVDEITHERAVGWAFRKDREETLDVVAVLNGRPVGHTIADRYRPDLHQAGLGDGHCGFEITFGEPVSVVDLPFVSFKIQGSSLHLPRTHDKGLVDLVHVLLGQFPGAGRSRTIYGGLWTDRTDSLHVLTGRAANGLDEADLRSILHSFIADGFVETPLEPDAEAAEALRDVAIAAAHLASSGDTERLALKAKVEKILDFLAEPQLVALLQAVLVDRPVVYDIRTVGGDQPVFTQLSRLGEFTSPAECLGLYLCTQGRGSRLETVRESHELPEFDQFGRSRWTPRNGLDLSDVAQESGRPVESTDLVAGKVVVVSPGLIHRVVANEAVVVRVLCAPKRVTPTRYLSSEASWIEVGHASGMRARL